ncbi:inorganic phosphate transporter [Alkaliflexus imshenetskii]|uniref:inorganic phosphate transporter n=1 Tax=Alkaliflexus imshenetskii TaxID=286730 RepID=UPI000478CA5B|nr:inorganic phosphate transporter [Alkaliflexus imshenetskii]
MLLIWTCVTLLSLLAFFHLVVGVSNDAVNFLNSAIGSRIASRRAVLWTAGAGLLIGTFFSGGMMEVVRNGVINPNSLHLSDLLIVFVAVSIINVIVIDAYNSIGFPTSTTIAVIFSLIGGGLAVVMMKGAETGMAYSGFINTDRIFLIFAGILVSILMAFVMGAVVQFVTRLIFTFQYQGRFTLLFAFGGAFAFTAILFLIFKKGVGGVIWEEHFNTFVELTLMDVLIPTFIIIFFVLWGLGTLIKIDIPRLVVFFGTFALALSFAANDLVNFIGLPLTGIESFKEFLNTPGADINTFSLHFLDNDWIRGHHFQDGIYMTFFVLAGAIMMITVFYSKKSRSVTETEVYLGRQAPGYEQFEPSPTSRLLVRRFLSMYQKVEAWLPAPVHNFISARFARSVVPERHAGTDELVYFDTVRATVNLVVAVLLISVGTYLRFPLSTTFVVFMVSMGTSFADQAWGRESAVYRISGVLSVLGGWFITALTGFLGAFIFTLLIWWGGWVMALVLFALMILTLIGTTRYHHRKQQQIETQRQGFINEQAESVEWLRETGSENVRKQLLEISKIYFLIINGLIDENLKQLREAVQKSELLQQAVKNHKEELFRTYSKLPDEVQDAGHLFVQALDYLTELSNTLSIVAPLVYSHVENQHKGLTNVQQDDLSVILDEVTSYLNFVIHFEKEKRFDALAELKTRQRILIDTIEEYRLEQIRRIRSGEGKTRVNVIYMELLGETKNMLIYCHNLFQALREFYIHSGNKT